MATTMTRSPGSAESPGQDATQALAPRHMHAALQAHPVGGTYTLDELYRLAQVCQASGLFEDITDASQALVKIMKGQELGLPPMAAMGAFDLIKKRMFMKPWAMAAKINSCGYGYFVVQEQTTDHCTIVFSRKYPGKGWVDCVPVTYTIQEAKAHGLVDRSPHWKASPAHMLYQRALGRGAVMYFPELTAGLEPPQDDTPLAPERLTTNVTDLFGEQAPAQTFEDTVRGTPPKRETLPKGATPSAGEGAPVPGGKSTQTTPTGGKSEPVPDGVDPETGELFTHDKSAARDWELMEDSE